jgi:hypothetical protein
MRRRLLVVAAALAGCTALPPLETRLQPWIGRGEAELVTAFGVPARTYEAGDRRFLQYEERRAQLLPADPWWPGWPHRGPWWYAPPPPPAYVVRGCDVTFVLRRGVVEGFTFRGDGCR